jgi:hypothetical protein
MKKGPEASISLGRHAAECKICAHSQIDEIERDFINWRSPASIAKHYKLANRASVYRHAHALGLYYYPNGLEEGRSRARHGE